MAHIKSAGTGRKGEPTMKQVYEFTRELDGEPRLEVVMLLSPNECDFDEVLHRVGMDFCMSPRGRKLHGGATDLTFGELMGSLTPEMLKPYGVTMYRLRDGAKQMDGAAPVVSAREMGLYQGLRDGYAQQLRDLREYGERIARRLEAQRRGGHPAISTWDPNIIPGRAIAWAYLYVTGNERDLTTFFNRKLQEAKPHAVAGAGVPAGADPVEDDSAGQRAGQEYQ